MPDGEANYGETRQQFRLTFLNECLDLVNIILAFQTNAFVVDGPFR